MFALWVICFLPAASTSSSALGPVWSACFFSLCHGGFVCFHSRLKMNVGLSHRCVTPLLRVHREPPRGRGTPVLSHSAAAEAALCFDNCMWGNARFLPQSSPRDPITSFSATDWHFPKRTTCTHRALHAGFERALKVLWNCSLTPAWRRSTRSQINPTPYLCWHS